LFFFFSLDPKEPADGTATMKEMFKYWENKQRYLSQVQWHREEAARKKTHLEMKKVQREIEELKQKKAEARQRRHSVGNISVDDCGLTAAERDEMPAAAIARRMVTCNGGQPIAEPYEFDPPLLEDGTLDQQAMQDVRDSTAGWADTNTAIIKGKIRPLNPVRRQLIHLIDCLHRVQPDDNQLCFFHVKTANHHVTRWKELVNKIQNFSNPADVRTVYETDSMEPGSLVTNKYKH
jgi:hypothetical protein